MAITLVLVDDHPIVLDGLERLFGLHPDIEILARCTRADDALHAVRRLKPDVLVLDVRMPEVSGLELLRALNAQWQDAQATPRVVLLTAVADDDQLLLAVRLGAQAIVLKEMASNFLVDAIRQVHAGGQWLETGLGGRGLRQLLCRSSSGPRGDDRLSTRERDVVRLVAQGLRNRAIAERLQITEGTVKVHLHNAYEKLAVTNRVELMIYAREHALI